MNSTDAEITGEMAYHTARGDYEVAQIRAKRHNWPKFGELSPVEQAYWVAKAYAPKALPEAWMSEDNLTITAKTKETLPEGGQSYFPIPLELTPEAMRNEWLQAGGKIHGPNVETVSMPESLYFKFRGTRFGGSSLAALPVVFREGPWIHISEQWPAHGQRIEAENGFGEKWIEVFDASGLVGSIVHWRAAPLERAKPAEVEA